MKRIMKFESFSNNHRLPKRISADEFDKKIEIHGIEPLTQKEVEFFRKLVDKNNPNIRSYIPPDDPSKICLDIYYLYTETILFYIHKLTDDWYLICKYSGPQESYICDEWDEVLGYLEYLKLKI
jgi:hypothetical protein